MSTYYLMHCVEGDECLLANLPDFESASRRLEAEAARDSHAELSIWLSNGAILALWHSDLRILELTPQGVAHYDGRVLS